ncbi:hypothetical protein [Mucilaginibacter gilvus]|uniref:Lipocalin-like domain-containing protein n=1 Tax=Mucilaginibacter gilvus TaxID=2305909 RepID=A0A3S4Y5M4_9SPHI|nr:hypothetical protein [Mucilaginibacter gilvus]RWY47963.1 hypothetical protein EPL05_20445 [Mucilaginibacter gilvus]
MNKISFVTGAVTIAIFCFSCGIKKAESKKFSIVGTWRYFSNSGNNGVKSYIDTVPNTINQYLIFYEKGELKGDYLPNGFYRLKRDTLIIKTTQNAILKYRCTFNENTLYISPAMICDEGCPIEKFMKQN